MLVGRQPAGAAPDRRGAGQRTPGPDTRVTLGRWLRLLRLRRGRSGSRMAEDRRRVTVRGWLRGAIPPADDPGEPSRPPPGPPASVRASRSA
jgi:hypothetical protein